jgi:hypothetical protein
MRVWWLYLVTLSSWAQPRPLASIELPTSPAHVFVDRAGELYLAYADGLIEKRTKDGQRISDIRPDPPLANFDPANAMWLLGFDRTNRKVVWYFPNLNVYQAFELDPALAIEPWLLGTSGDRDFWIADAADHSLKKIRSADQTVQREFSLPHTVPPIREMIILREYQRFIFLVHPQTGIFIVNEFGKHIRTIPEPNLTYVQFFGEELYFQRGQELIFFDFFSAETRAQTLPISANTALLSDERMWLLNGRQLTVLEYKP